MKKIVILVFIISIAGFAALKGSLWYFTQQFVDKQVLQAKPFAQISYKEIKTSLTGSATVSGIKIYSPSFDDSVFIESIQFMAPDLMTLITLDYQLSNKKLPESLNLIIKGARIELNGSFMQLADNPDIEPSQLEVFSTLACGETYRIGSKALSDMGYENITTDILLSYQHNARNKTLSYKLNNNILGMTHFKISGQLRNVTGLDSLVQHTAQPGTIEIEIIDDSYINQKNLFCAAQGGRKINEYIKEHILQVEEYLLSYGIETEEGLLNAYKTIIETSAPIRLEADLSKLTGTKEIISFEPNDIIQFIRLKLFVN
ncbi:MAG: hypothetical protein GY694_03330, partial [Gammaproteobacteria bacterium]|nr:hypothetical protein [Gammaproteobacteria bacterium]